MMFKRPSVRYAKTPEPTTPYQKAAQAWDERMGSARVQAKNWRYMAISCLTTTAVFGLALVWQSTQGTIVPYVVEVDRLGAAQTVAPASANYRPTDPQIAFHLARFIENVRQVPADPIVLRENWLRAYDFATDRGAVALNDFARVNDPFARVGEVQISAEISSVISASATSIRVAWTERRYVNGQLAGTDRWTGILSVAIQPPRDAERLRKNPLGVFVHAINWSRENTQ